MSQTAVTNDPPSQQLVVNNSSAQNRTARPGPYVDQSLTLENVSSTPATLDLPPGSGSTTLGSTRSVYANDQLDEIDNVAAAAENASVQPPPASPNSWEISTDTSIPGVPIPRSRDPYRNNGLDGYLQNGG